MTDDPHLETAGPSRGTREVHQAIGVLMELHHLAPEAAYTTLRLRAAASQIDVVDYARALVLSISESASNGHENS
jgi:AmiR/NasT family two-component response regulator